MNDQLLAACAAGRLDAVEDAHARGADLHCYGDSPMLKAALGGHFAVVMYLIIHGDSEGFHVGRGVLRVLCKRGDTQMAELLWRFATPKEAAAARLEKEARA